MNDTVSCRSSGTIEFDSNQHRIETAKNTKRIKKRTMTRKNKSLESTINSTQNNSNVITCTYSYYIHTYIYIYI